VNYRVVNSTGKHGNRYQLNIGASAFI